MRSKEKAVGYQRQRQYEKGAISMKKKAYITGVLAAAIGLGIMTAAPSAEAAQPVQQLSYENGASNEYSFRMKEEDRVHEQNVRKIRFEFRRDGDQAKYDRARKEEQKRHDQAVKIIKRDYQKRPPWRH